MQQHVYSISQTCEAAGIRHVIICPGSRSAPLVFAFTGNKSFKCYSVIDERSAGYMALGMAQQLQQPVALVCTSGTAALNFYPAIAEAFFQKVPLLVLTADRPSELLYQQDGQMIVQKNVFEKNILASFELPCSPEGREDLRHVGNMISRAIRIASDDRGPVHVNIPLSEPLYGTLQSNTSLAKQASFYDPIPAQAKSPGRLIQAWKSAEKKVLLIGQMPVNNALFTALYELTKSDDVVILADVLSNKQSLSAALRYDFIIAHSDQETLDTLQPDLLISMGGPVLSKSLKLWLKSFSPRHHFRIGKDRHCIDTYNHNSFPIVDLPETTLAQLPGTSSENGLVYRALWEKLDRLAGMRINDFLQKSPFSELGATNTVMNYIPDAVNFHLANSSPIRYVSNIGIPNDSWVMSGNRGTSGIDGCSSTAVGAALVNARQTVLLTGDLSFLYDKNAFWNQHVPDSLRVIVINNNGGGIFTLIDGPGKFPGLLNFFTTPHKQSIKNTAIDNRMDYYFCDSAEGLEKELRTFFNPRGKAAVLEIKINMSANTRVYNTFKTIKLR